MVDVVVVVGCSRCRSSIFDGSSSSCSRTSSSNRNSYYHGVVLAVAGCVFFGHEYNGSESPGMIIFHYVILHVSTNVKQVASTDELIGAGQQQAA